MKAALASTLNNLISFLSFFSRWLYYYTKMWIYVQNCLTFTTWFTVNISTINSAMSYDSLIWCLHHDSSALNIAKSLFSKANQHLIYKLKRNAGILSVTSHGLFFFGGLIFIPVSCFWCHRVRHMAFTTWLNGSKTSVVPWAKMADLKLHPFSGFCHCDESG